MEVNLIRRRVIIYLSLIYSFLLAGWIAIAIDPQAYIIVWGLFSVFPVVATLIARKLTADKSSWHVKPNLRRNRGIYLLSAFGPGVAIFLGALAFFFLFPQDIDFRARYIVENYARFGAPASLQLTIQNIVAVGIAAIFISPFVLPVHLFALGEEIGWRGYLLPLLLQMTSTKKAVLLHGFLWGIAHAVLIYFGFNYATNYWGAPYSGMTMMILVSVVLGIWLAYVTIKSNSIIPATILHGASNVIGELPVMVSLMSVSPLLGPNPTGIIGLSGLLLGAVILFLSLPEKTDLIDKSEDRIKG
jgi:membrane protease YdiL (CAAX protease family)